MEYSNKKFILKKVEERFCIERMFYKIGFYYFIKFLLIIVKWEFVYRSFEINIILIFWFNLYLWGVK